MRDVPPALAAAVARALARDPERRYEDAAEMEDALRDGLAGIAHTEDLDATQHLPDDEATRMLSPTSAGRRRRAGRCSPSPRTAVAPRRPPAPARRRPPQPPRKESSGAGKWVALLLVIALIAGGVVAYQAVNSSSAKQVSSTRTVGEATQSLKT